MYIVHIYLHSALQRDQARKAGKGKGDQAGNDKRHWQSPKWHGTSASSSFSRMLAIMIMAIEKPRPEPSANAIVSMKLYLLPTLESGTARMIQFVEISAR